MPLVKGMKKQLTKLEKLENRVRRVLARCKFKDVTFAVHTSNNTVKMRVEFEAIDATDGTTKGTGHGRSWLITDSWTDSEIVQLALLSVLQSQEHEVREFFTYRGQAIFNPHFSHVDLYNLCKQGKGTRGARKK